MRLYQALLILYPSEFRREYGGAMLQVFRDCGNRALREAGNAGLLHLWIRTMLDTVQTAIEEHAQRGVDMSKSKFVKLSGWAVMLGGLAMVLGWLAGTRPEYDRFNARSLAIDQYANAAAFPLLVMSSILLGVGFIGLLLRYGLAAGSFGQTGLMLGVISGLIGTAGGIGLEIFDTEPWWSMWFFGMVFQFLGLAFFGIASLRRRYLPRWNGVPILAGIWIPSYVLIGILSEQVSGRWVEMPEVITIFLLLLTLAGLIGLGFLLLSDSRPVGRAAAPA
jgi:hypothetical protein